MGITGEGPASLVSLLYRVGDNGGMRVVFLFFLIPLFLDCACGLCVLGQYLLALS